MLTDSHCFYFPPLLAARGIVSICACFAACQKFVSLLYKPVGEFHQIYNFCAPED